MAEATSITCTKVQDFMDGSMLFELKSTATDGETITIPTTGDGSWVNTSSIVQLVNANDVTNGTVATTCAYTKASRLFTFVKSGVTDCDLRILFKAKNE